MHRVVRFEIHADDPRRASDFYHRVFEWKISQWGDQPYWICETGPADKPGINGGIMKRRDPAGAVYNTIQIPSVDAWTDKILAAGGKNVVPKMAIPGVGWLAYFQDTEGNVFGIMEEDAAAK